MTSLDFFSYLIRNCIYSQDTIIFLITIFIHLGISKNIMDEVTIMCCSNTSYFCAIIRNYQDITLGKRCFKLFNRNINNSNACMFSSNVSCVKNTPVILCSRGDFVQIIYHNS